jgi:protease PrsW
MRMNQWHYLNPNRQTLGPFDVAQIAELIGRGQVDADTPVWYPGWPSWVPLAQAWQTMGLPAAPPARAMPVPQSFAPSPGIQVLAPGQNPWSISSFAANVTDLVGLERIEGFRFSDMYSSVFKKYGDEAIESYFSVGLRATTPPLEQVTTKWPQPWMFARMLGLSLLLYIGFFIAVVFMEATVALPALIITGSFAVPLATLVFFFEMNAPQNVSLYQVMKLFALGGVVSILISLVLFSTTGLSELIGAPSAGLIEETGKLLTVIFLTRKMDPQRYPYITNGLLFGAAVGTGFAAFESAGYAMNIMLSSSSIGAGNFNIILRGVLAPFGHVAWTAIAAGALWSVKGAKPFSISMLFQSRMITLFCCSMGLHFVWNMDITGPFLLKYWILGFIAWVLVFALLQMGLKQVRASRTVTQTMTRGLSVAQVQEALRQQAAQANKR